MAGWQQYETPPVPLCHGDTIRFGGTRAGPDASYENFIFQVDAPDLEPPAEPRHILAAPALLAKPRRTLTQAHAASQHVAEGFPIGVR